MIFLNELRDPVHLKETEDQIIKIKEVHIKELI